MVSTPKMGDKPGSHMTLSQSLTNYLRWHGIEGSTDVTIQHKRSELRMFLAWLESEGHSMLVGDLTKFDVLGFLQSGRERSLSPVTLNTRFRSIRAWLNWMVDWDILEESPLARFKAPRAPQKAKPFLSQDDVKALLSCCRLDTLTGARRAAMIWLLLTTGIRRRELSMLKIADLDETGGIIHVVYGKGQRERWVPFMKECQLAMLRYLQFRTDTLSWLWVTAKGERLGYEGLGGDMKKLIKESRISVIDAMHIFRRTFAARAVEQSIPREYVQAIGGWSSDQMLSRYTAWMKKGKQGIDAFQGFKPLG